MGEKMKSFHEYNPCVCYIYNKEEVFSASQESDDSKLYFKI